MLHFGANNSQMYRFNNTNQILTNGNEVFLSIYDFRQF